MFVLNIIFLIFMVAVLGIGIYMVWGHHKNGRTTPPVLSGIAFILLSLPVVLSILVPLVLSIF